MKDIKINKNYVKRNYIKQRYCRKNFKNVINNILRENRRFYVFKRISRM